MASRCGPAVVTPITFAHIEMQCVWKGGRNFLIQVETRYMKGGRSKLGFGTLELKDREGRSHWKSCHQRTGAMRRAALGRCSLAAWPFGGRPPQQAMPMEQA